MREPGTEQRSCEDSDVREDRYLGNYYGYHDGYDGSVFGTSGIAKTIVARVGGVACVIEVFKKEEEGWKRQEI